MKTFGIFLIATLIFSLSTITAKAGAGNKNWPSECQGKPPHYLVGLSQEKDQIDILYQVHQVYLMSSADSNTKSPFGANLGESIELAFYGHTFTLYLPMYRRSSEMVYYHTANSITPLTEQEFSCVKADLRAWIQSGIDGDFADHKMISDLAVESFAKRNKKTPDEVRDLLSKPIPEYGTNYADVLQIPQLEPADFIKSIKFAYFMPMGSCNAYVFLKNILAFTPCVRRLDYVVGKNEVIKHELIHANIKLQGHPISWYVNVELLAALMPFLESPTNLNTFFYHGYLSSPWEALKVFGGFDVEKIRKEIFRYELYKGGSAINREVLSKYIPEINRAAQWLRESAIKVLWEYYSDQHAWVAINNMSHDDDMAYKVIMAKLYEPTLLGGHNTTVRFILKHGDRSAEVAKRAWENVGKPLKIESDLEHKKFSDDIKAFAKMLGLTDDIIARVGKYYGFKVEDFKNMDLNLLRRVISDFLQREGAFQGQTMEVR